MFQFYSIVNFKFVNLFSISDFSASVYSVKMKIVQFTKSGSSAVQVGVLQGDNVVDISHLGDY